MSVSWENSAVKILDQRKLPNNECYIICRTIEDVYNAIKQLSVRGAPAIGIAAAYGLIVGLKSFDLVSLKKRRNYLASARPTAVNLVWALDRMLLFAYERRSILDSLDMLQELEIEAIRIHNEDKLSCQEIGKVGLEIVKRYPNVLTHCNAGSLAVSELGTALAPIYLAHQEGINVHVYVDETRPLMQGARLTAFELGRAGINRTLITDSMAAQVMSKDLVDVVIVGADRVASNGDTANKIGTLNLAILCRHFGIPFYIACPWSTIDFGTVKGGDIFIEERENYEIIEIYGCSFAEVDTPVYNPAFDVTTSDLITGIITDRGIVSAPYRIGLENHGYE